MQGELRVIPVRGIGEVQPGEDLADLILSALERHDFSLANGDIVVITQKIVSKAEGRLIDPTTPVPSHMAKMVAAQGAKDAAYYEVVLQEARRIVRMDRGVLITETHHGLICANSGVDESNVAGGRAVTLLPVDPDASAAQVRRTIAERTGLDVAVIITDTFGRPWREGQVNFAIGVAGMLALADYTGQYDHHGYELRVSKIAVADELAAAAELVMGKIDAVPVAIVRGYSYTPGNGALRDLLRAPERDLFR
ncbi:MAG TPA: coenzyme F420-0:L-glutamate ligase [Roseiflexaceae bacterium]|nr:coenzyme F420-0:L-glutamate ligase [Roseiflexaceae bacterium]